MVKFIMGIIIGAVVVIFLVQNTDIMPIKFLIWQLSLPRSVVIIAIFIIGALFGWITQGFARFVKKEKTKMN